LEQLDLGVLYEVSAPSTPPEAREALLDRAARGEAVTIPEVREARAAFTSRLDTPQPRELSLKSIYETGENKPFISRPVVFSEGESRPLFRPPPPPDSDDSTVPWIERRLNNVLHHARHYGSLDDFYDLLVKAHDCFASDETFTAWLAEHGIAIADNPTIEELAMLAAWRLYRKCSPRKKGA